MFLATMHNPHAVDRAAARRTFEDTLGFSLLLPKFMLDAAVRESQNPAYTGFIRNYDPREELDEVLADVRVPTTIIWGERDGLLPIMCAHDLQGGIVNSELVLLPRVGHMPQVQAPRKVARLITETNA